mmetsp:Transcript_87841/g.226444  ORF Transcript_87841/g.226444 Transcript_87841/m.226444 type:complete len:96 (+) Transcript_87841:362-649(+)
MLMPMAVLFIYVGEFGYPENRMWKNGSWFPNTPHGIAFYAAKWIGMVCLFVGILQITKLHVKLRQKWQQINSRRTEVSRVKDETDGKVGAEACTT